jgi:hypothetical protein
MGFEVLSGGCEEFCFLGYTAVWSVENTTRRYIPEDLKVKTDKVKLSL